MFCVSYYCEACEKKFTSKAKIDKHIKTKKHKTRVDKNAPYKCDICSYKGYNPFLFYLHKRNIHNILSDRTYDKKKCIQKINKILIKFKRYNIDPNKYFNYKYYATNIKSLDKAEYNDFLKELQNIKI